MQQLTQDTVSAALARVYARAEFNERELPALLRWLRDFWNGVKAWLWSRLGALLELEATAPVLFWIIVAWLVAALILALSHIFFTLSMAFRGRDRSGAGRAAPTAAVTALRTADPAMWEARAREAAAAGRLREAALALYHAVILRLDARGAVRFRPGKTPGEYRREARRAAELGSSFDAFLRIFHPVAFGPHAPERSAWDSLRAAASRLDAHA